VSIENLRKYQQPGVWVYCQACDRCYMTGEEREVDDALWCAYEDCELGDSYDAVEWIIMRRHYPELPEKPERDVQYKPGYEEAL